MTGRGAYQEAIELAGPLIAKEKAGLKLTAKEAKKLQRCRDVEDKWRWFHFMITVKDFVAMDPTGEGYHGRRILNALDLPCGGAADDRNSSGATLE